MPTLILTPRYCADSQALWRAANRLGWRVERLINWRLPDELKLVPEPILYVEALMTEMIAEQLGLRLLDAPNDWLPNLPEEYRKRCFILNRSLKTFSVYLRDGELQRENDFAHIEEEEFEVREFIETLLSDERVEILQATVIDVGVIQGRGWAVVEQNAAWGAGLYGCDPIEVLEVLRYAVVGA